MNEFIFTFIQNNFIAIIIALFLTLFILSNNNFEKETNSYFLMSTCCIFALIITETWEAELALSESFEFFRIPLSAIGYSLRPLIPYLLILMLKDYPKKLRIILSIPLLFNTLVVYSALFTDIAFSYTIDNQFVRGPLGLTPFVVSFIYIAILLVLTIKKFRNGGLKEAIIVSAIVLLTLLSTIMESVFKFRFIQISSMAISVTFYYLFLHCNQSNRDPLTNLLTRRRFYLDADARFGSMSAVISLDLNDLKYLNDEFGHVEGDKALKCVAEIMDRHVNSNMTIYRVGGDEFMILVYRFNEEKIKKLIDELLDDFSKTKYECAIGYAMRRPGISFDDLCNEADKSMYNMKKKMKGIEEKTA